MEEALWDKVRHGSRHEPRTSSELQIQRMQASLGELERIGHQSQERCKWRKRSTVEDLKTRPKSALNRLSRSEEAISLIPAAYAAADG